MCQNLKKVFETSQDFVDANKIHLLYPRWNSWILIDKDKVINDVCIYLFVEPEKNYLRDP